MCIYRTLKMVLWRSIKLTLTSFFLVYVAVTMFLGMTFPFFGGLLAFFGGFAFAPTTYFVRLRFLNAFSQSELVINNLI